MQSVRIRYEQQKTGVCPECSGGKGQEFPGFSGEEKGKGYQAMKRIVALSMALLLVLACAGCSSGTTAYERSTSSESTDSASSGDSTTSSLKIAYSSVADESEAPWIGVLWNTMAEVCEENGWELDALSADGVPSQQTTQIETLLDGDPDYFVIFAGDVNLADEWVNKVHNSGIPVIMLGLDATDDVYYNVSAFVGPDQEALASQLAVDMINANGASAGLNVVAISGWEFQQDYILREEGFDKTLTYFSNYTLLATEYAGASREDAKEIMEDYLDTYGADGIDVVMAYDVEFAMGALEALEDAGLDGEIEIYSITGSNEVYEAIEDGLITEVATFSSTELAEECAAVITGLATGTIPDHYNYITREYVTADNVSEYAGNGEY